MARPGLIRNRKFLRLARTLGNVPLALGCLELIWEKSYENGDPYLGDAVDVEAAAQWPGEAGALCKALFTAGGDGHQGFIEELQDHPGHYQVHDLFDHAPRYVSLRLKKEMERKATGITISEIRAEAGRKGAAATNAKRSANVGKGPANEQQFVATPAPAPAPAPAQVESLVSQIGHLYPGNAHLEGRALPYLHEHAILLAIQADGPDVVLKGTQVYAEAVKRGLKFTYSVERFFGPEKHYLKTDWPIAEGAEVKPKVRKVPQNPADEVRRQIAEMQRMAAEPPEMKK